MPLTQDHLSIAKHNEEFYQSFDWDESPYNDWVVTGIFYAAIHYIEAYLDHVLSFHSGDHNTRDSAMGKLRELKVISHDYRSLKDDSENCRYDGQAFTGDEIRNDVEPNLEKIRVHITGLL